MKKLATLLSISTFLTLSAAGAAFAHVEVSPGEVSGGGSETFTVSVPTELDVPTTEVRMEIPEGFEVESVDEPSGWQAEEEEESGSVAAISWSGGEIPVEGSEDFTFEATAPDDAGEYPFRAIQTYEDGTVVEWTGSEDSNEPASVVTVSEGTSGGESGDASHDEHGHGSHESETTSAPLPDSGGAGYAALGAGLAMMLLGAALLRRRV